MKTSDTQLKLQVLERDLRRSSLLVETLGMGELSPRGEEERLGDDPGSLDPGS